MKLQIQCQNFANQRSIASGIHHPASCKNSLPATTISKGKVMLGAMLLENLFFVCFIEVHLDTHVWSWEP